MYSSSRSKRVHPVCVLAAHDQRSVDRADGQGTYDGRNGERHLLLAGMSHVTSIPTRHTLDPLADQVQKRILDRALPPPATRSHDVPRHGTRDPENIRQSSLSLALELLLDALELLLHGFPDHAPQLVRVLLLARAQELHPEGRRSREGVRELDRPQRGRGGSRGRVERCESEEKRAGDRCREGRRGGGREGRDPLQVEEEIGRRSHRLHKRRVVRVLPQPGYQLEHALEESRSESTGSRRR